MGEVWQAVDLRLGRNVAVKLLRPRNGARPDTEHRERFGTEVGILADLDHPNIVPISDYGEHPTRRGPLPFFVMKLIDGQDLEHAVPRGRRMPPAKLIPLLRQITEAVGHAHRLGIVHRDLKPGNVLLDGHGTAWVCDFGVAKVLERTFGPAGSQDTFIGTRGYMAPERMPGSNAATDPVSDLYSLGCIAYRMLTGLVPPFPEPGRPGPAPSGVLGERDVPHWLDELVVALLSAAPEARPSSAGRVLELLDAGGGAAGPVPPTGPRTPRPRSAPPAPSDPPAPLAPVLPPPVPSPPPTTAQSLREQADAAFAEPNYAAAQTRYQRLAGMIEAQHGERHPEAMECSHRAANCALGLGQFEEAVEQFAAVARRRTARLGEGHRDTLASRTGLAQSLRALGRPDEALAELEAVARLQDGFGPDTEPAMAAWHAAAVCAFENGDLAGACHRFGQVADSREAILGRLHADALHSRLAQARCLHEQGLLKDARVIYAELLPRFRQVFPADDEWLGYLQRELAGTRGADAEGPGSTLPEGRGRWWRWG
jgi:hypothetical protein